MGIRFLKFFFTYFSKNRHPGKLHCTFVFTKKLALLYLVKEVKPFPGWQTAQRGKKNKVIIHHSKSLYESLLLRSHCVVCHPERGRFCAKNGPFCHFQCNIVNT